MKLINYEAKIGQTATPNTGQPMIDNHVNYFTNSFTASIVELKRLYACDQDLLTSQNWESDTKHEFRQAKFRRFVHTRTDVPKRKDTKRIVSPRLDNKTVAGFRFWTTPCSGRRRSALGLISRRCRGPFPSGQGFRSVKLIVHFSLTVPVASNPPLSYV